MPRTTSLLALGLLVAVSTPALARVTTQPHPAATPMLLSAPIGNALSVPDTIWAPSPTLRSRADVKAVQTWLAQLKLYDGFTNGLMGPDTHDALRRFERAHNLPVTGQISDTLMVLLRKEAAAVAPSTK
jgi:peptidoglycan hydrolase-like protein with peptidoglycan-binding domain